MVFEAAHRPSVPVPAMTYPKISYTTQQGGIRQVSPTHQGEQRNEVSQYLSINGINIFDYVPNYSSGNSKFISRHLQVVQISSVDLDGSEPTWSW